MRKRECGVGWGKISLGISFAGWRVSGYGDRRGGGRSGDKGSN